MKAVTPSPRWHEVTALFGGRFDPPHRGHVDAVHGLFKSPGVKEVVILPSGIAPHKPAIASGLQRTDMTTHAFSQLQISSSGNIRIDRREMDQAQKNPLSPSYTFNTLIELRSSYSNLAFTVGADQIAALHSWHRFPDLLTLCHWIILARKPNGDEQARETLRQWEASGLVRPQNSSSWTTSQSGHRIELVNTDARDISSTQIRESIARTGEPPPDALLPSVWSYIKDQRLYGA